MSQVDQLPLNTAARAFATGLLARHPDWAPFIGPYERVGPADTTEEGSLRLEVPSPGEPASRLWAIVQDGEAVVGLGHRAAEANFDWDSADRASAIEAILDFVDDVAAAEVIGAWERHRWLWRTWETCHFRRAADVVGDARVMRVSAWPAAPGQHHEAAT